MAIIGVNLEAVERSVYNTGTIVIVIDPIVKLDPDLMDVSL